MGYTVIHKKDISLNRHKLKNILNTKKMNITELYNRAQKDYGLSLSYKSFTHQLANKTTWKLLYAWVIAKILDSKIEDIFEIIEVDIEEKKKEKEEWKEKYEKKNDRFENNP